MDINVFICTIAHYLSSVAPILRKNMDAIIAGCIYGAAAFNVLEGKRY